MTIQADSNYIPPDDAGPLTVSDLIQILSACPPDLIACFPRDEGGFSPVVGIKQLALLTNANTDFWYGPHDYPDSMSAMEKEAKKLISEDYIILLR
jgi:hypothetical protein